MTISPGWKLSGASLGTRSACSFFSNGLSPVYAWVKLLLMPTEVVWGECCACWGVPRLTWMPTPVIHLNAKLWLLEVLCPSANWSKNSSWGCQIFALRGEAWFGWYCKVMMVASHAIKFVLRCVSFHILIFEVNILTNCLARPLIKNLAFANNIILDGELKGAHVHALLSNMNLCWVKLRGGWVAEGFLWHRMPGGVRKMRYWERPNTKEKKKDFSH